MGIEGIYVKTKEVEIRGIKFVITELPFLDILDNNVENVDKKERQRIFIKQAVVSPKLTDEDINKMAVSVGNQLIKEINDLNGFTVPKDKDFLPEKSLSGN